MKKIHILGVAIRDYTLKESLTLTDEYLKNGAMNTVLFVSAKMLLAAGENPELKEWIESMDMTVCAETDILRAADMAASNIIPHFCAKFNMFLQIYYNILYYYIVSRAARNNMVEKVRPKACGGGIDYGSFAGAEGQKSRGIKQASHKEVIFSLYGPAFPTVH